MWVINEVQLIGENFMFYEISGGILIGAAAALLWLGVGRIGGMTSVMSGLFAWQEPGRRWTYAFLIGLLLAWPIYQIMGYDAPIHITNDKPLLITAGLLVGFGTYVGNGCTSGHGVCGMGRLSWRSIVATVIFMLAGIVTVAMMNALKVTP